MWPPEVRALSKHFPWIDIYKHRPHQNGPVSRLFRLSNLRLHTRVHALDHEDIWMLVDSQLRGHFSSYLSLIKIVSDNEYRMQLTWYTGIDICLVSVFPSTHSCLRHSWWTAWTATQWISIPVCHVRCILYNYLYMISTGAWKVQHIIFMCHKVWFAWRLHVHKETQAHTLHRPNYVTPHEWCK